MNQNDYTSLIAALNEAVAILDRNRTPDPAFIAAYDTLRQSRAMIVKALACPGESAALASLELAAA